MDEEISAGGIGHALIQELRIFRESIWSLACLLVGPALLVLLCGEAIKSPSVNRGLAWWEDLDGSDRSREFVQLLTAKNKLLWNPLPAGTKGDLGQDSAVALLVIPENWGTSLVDGDPKPVRLVVDATDPMVSAEVESSVREILREFQQNALQEILDTLPEEVIELGKQLEVSVRKRFVSWMTPWTAEIEARSQLRLVDFLLPGILGLIFQTLAILIMVSRGITGSAQLRGRLLAGLAVLAPAIALAFIISAIRFGYTSGSIFAVAFLSLAFLACSLALGGLFSACFKRSFTAALMAIFYIIAGAFVSGAFFSVIRLPEALEKIGYVFPLTWFCKVAREIQVHQAGFGSVLGTSGGLLAAAAVLCFLTLVITRPRVSTSK